MNYSDEAGVQVSLPQFSEINSRSNSGFTSSAADLQAAASAIYTTAVGSNQSKHQQILVNSQNKYPGTILTWPDPNTLIQLCEKQGIQAINIPNYSQTVSNNASILNVQSNSLPPNCQMQLQQQSTTMTEYLQKLQATTLPLTLQQLIKLQSEQMKREKQEEEQKIEQTQNSILNIPSVPGYRNATLQNGNHFMNPEHMMLAINPSDLNIHMEGHESDGSSHAIKVEHLQTESPKPEKKMKFRAKTGEIKITMAVDGSTIYCCPECNLAFADKSEIEQHIQGHIQERKYQCKECGAMLKRKEHLDQHMRGHSDERPFKCPVCQKAFKRNEHLTRHYVIHSGDKNFTCSVCQKAFSRKDHLNKHAQTHLGAKRTKAKSKDLVFSDRDALDKFAEMSAAMPKQDVNFILKDGTFIKQEATLLQQIQSLQKDSNLMQTFSAFKEQALKDGSLFQQQAVNMNDILPQNTRYLMPS
ncbi:zinc finger protein 90 homolog isoform X2 [Belonocnema kinseyi]|uniref:zinc finger protein 90 homolog isoform X2 n=1 Tax=Belonocnema kinseyi TaxID=2817044 RepID=UPI00143DDD21|nr:zinc finger protein 90 homolog isoform X2 [Belonocnema kinseyi]